MSMSTYVQGFILPDEKFLKMLQVYNSCKDANIACPDEVLKFFNYDIPNKAGVQVNLDHMDGIKEIHPDEMSSGYEIDLRKLDPDIKIIWFVNSW